MDELFIPVILGTSRKGRQSEQVAKLVVEIAEKIEGVRTELVDPLNFNLPGDGNADEVKDPKYTKITEEADGFFIVVPEYNHAFPGSLKRLLDSELKNYIHKPVAFAGVSAGPWGGIRAIEALVTTVREMGMVATFKDVQFPSVQNLFENGKLKDEAYIKRVEKSLNELIWMANVLKYGRENTPSE